MLMELRAKIEVSLCQTTLLEGKGINKYEMFPAKLKAKGITPQSDFLTWCHVKEEFPAALHAKLAVGADRTRKGAYCMDGSSNFSRYGSGSDHFYLTASGRTRTHPNMSTESMLLSPVLLDSDCWRSWAFEITRKDLGLLREGRIVDIQTSTLTNYKSTLESEKRDQSHFKALLIDTRTLQEREEEKLARKVNSVVNGNAQKAYSTFDQPDEPQESFSLESICYSHQVSPGTSRFPPLSCLFKRISRPRMICCLDGQWEFTHIAVEGKSGTCDPLRAYS